MRETREELRSPTAAAAVGEFAPNPGELADRWAALLTEWRRIAAHLAATEADVYNTALDETGSTWAWEREERHARVLRERAAWAERQREKGDELHAELWLGAADPCRGGAGRADPERGLDPAGRAGERR
ncbi:hypothetical protein ACFVBM_22645 [Streptomyces griseus]|uniref:hypothetical protein n=1 Tax=Streptomyces griseus TaxID=1911 RepID=UPI0036979370